MDITLYKMQNMWEYVATTSKFMYAFSMHHSWKFIFLTLLIWSLESFCWKCFDVEASTTSSATWYVVFSAQYAPRSLLMGKGEHRSAWHATYGRATLSYLLCSFWQWTLFDSNEYFFHSLGVQGELAEESHRLHSLQWWHCFLGGQPL
jgi:hypothetical protein